MQEKEILVCGRAAAARIVDLLAQLNGGLVLREARTQAELLTELEKGHQPICVVEHEVPLKDPVKGLAKIFGGLVGRVLPNTEDRERAEHLFSNTGVIFSRVTTAYALLPKLLAASPGTQFVITSHMKGGGIPKEMRELYKQRKEILKIMGFANSDQNSEYLTKLFSRVYLRRDNRNSKNRPAGELAGPKLGESSHMRNIDTPVWSNDGKRVCYMGRPLRGADPKTFEVLFGCYARDARSVFFHEIRSQKIDRATFRVLNANFGVDATHAYFVVTPIPGADPKTFRVLDSSYIPCLDWFSNGGYAADANSVWFAGDGIYRIKNADPKTFVSLGNGFGYDGERAYYERAMLSGADRPTWRVWRGNLSVDKDSVFFTNKRVDGVDRLSIWLLAAEGCFMDRHRVYCNGRPISVKEYIELLKHPAENCAWERKWLSNGKLFERILDEWPKDE